MSESRSKTESLIVDGPFDPAKVEAAVREWIAANAGPNDTVRISPVERGHEFSTIFLEVESPTDPAESLTNAQIVREMAATLELLKESLAEERAHYRADTERLEAENARLRALFSEEDATLCDEWAEDADFRHRTGEPGSYDPAPARDLAARIRRAIGEPEQRQPEER